MFFEFIKKQQAGCFQKKKLQTITRHIQRETKGKGKKLKEAKGRNVEICKQTTNEKEEENALKNLQLLQCSSKVVPVLKEVAA